MSEKRDLLSSIGGPTPSQNPSPSPGEAGQTPPAAGMPQLRTVAGDNNAAPPQTSPPPIPNYAQPFDVPNPAPLNPDAAPATPPPAYTYSEPEARFNRPLILSVLGIGFIAAVAALLSVFLPAGAATVPADFDDFIAPDSTFALKTPQGWKRLATGTAAGEKDGTRADGVYADSGAAHMEVTFSTVAGLTQAQLLYGKDLTPEAMTGSRASGVDKLQRPAVKHKFQGYKETKVDDVPSSMGGLIPDEKTKSFKPDAVLYEFTATGNSWGMGGPVHGYRASLAGSKLIAAVLCYCPEKEWTKLQPAFLKYIGGVQEIREKGAEGEGNGLPGGGLPDTSAPVGIPNGLVPGGGGQ